MGEGQLVRTDGQDALPRGLLSADLTGGKAAPQAIQQTVRAVRSRSLHPHYSALPLLCENSHRQHVARGLCSVPGKLPLENLAAQSQNCQRLHCSALPKQTTCFHSAAYRPGGTTSHPSQATAWPLGLPALISRPDLHSLGLCRAPPVPPDLTKERSVSKSWKRQGRDSPLKPAEASPVYTLTVVR